MSTESRIDIVGHNGNDGDHYSETRVVNKYHEDYDIYIGRGSIWGNPFKIGEHGTREEVISLYRAHILDCPNKLKHLEELRGKRLGCFCKPKACHGDVLIELLEEGK